MCILTISSGNLRVYGNLPKLAGVPETLKIMIEMMVMVMVMMVMVIVMMVMVMVIVVVMVFFFNLP